MAKVLVTVRVMPEGVEVDLSEVESVVRSEVGLFGGKVVRVEVEPVAFGLKALKIVVMMDESLGGTDLLEERIREKEGVMSVEVVDVRRAVG